MLDFSIDRWRYKIAEMPRFSGVKLVLISVSCFGPLEVDELGIDSDHRPYELHEWLEDDFYADENYCRNISVNELLTKIEKYKQQFQKQELTSQVLACDRIISWLKTNYNEEK